MNRINLTESIIRKHLYSVINEMIEEDRIEDNNGVVEIDNFNNIKELLKFEKPGDTLYFVQIVKRDKDNPGQHSKYYAAQYLKEYYFKSLQEFEKAEREIKYICTKESARAYIYLNARSAAEVDKWTKINQQRMAKNPKMAKIFNNNAKALAAGRSFDAPDRPLCFVDIDSDDQNDINIAMKIIQDAGIKPLYAYRSLNNGLHIILPNKEDAKKLDFSKLNGNLNGMSKRVQMNAKVGIEIDKPVLLYAYLKPQGYARQQARFAKWTGQKQ